MDVVFRLLGAVEVRAGGRVLPVGSPLQRAVLAALLVDAGQVVPVDTLLDRVWGEPLPPRAHRTLHTYVSRIRRLLELVDGGPVPLVRRGGGYLIGVDRDRVDLHRFRRLVAQAGDPRHIDADRVLLLRQAIALWGGEPLGGLGGDWVARVREGWRQLHLDAVLAWARAELRVGHPTALTVPLTELVEEHPLVEPLTAALIRALRATGRTGEALRWYAAIRRRLAEELGADPGPELQELHRAMLRGEDADGAKPAALSPVPAQLPMDVHGFTGRERELARLDAVLAAAYVQPTAVVISALSGAAGVGKTALAVHWAHRVRDRFPDGQLYLNLRGFDPGGRGVEPGDALRRFLDVLGVARPRMPRDVEAQAGLYRSLLADRQMLIVLDNARDIEQVRPLLPGAPGCLVLVTSRSQLTSLVATHGGHPLILDLLTVDEARALLARRLGPDRVAAAPRAVDEIIVACARLPLALVIVAAQAAGQPQLSLDSLAAELRDNRDRLDALTGNDPTTDVRAVFSWSYRTLTPTAARLFRLLGLHPGPDLSAAAAASLAGLTLSAVRPVLAELAGVHLIVEHTPGRYTFHDLLRAYAVDLARQIDPEDERHAATHRVLDHYLHTAHAANRLINPTRDAITLSQPGAGVSPESFADHDQALAWFTAEHRTLLTAIEYSASFGSDAHTWQTAWALSTYLDRRGHWHDYAATQRAALAAVQRLDDPLAQARIRRLHAQANIQLGQFDTAHHHLRHALDLYQQVGDAAGQAHTHLHLVVVRGEQGRYVEALDHARQALALFRTADHRPGQALALNAIGWHHAQLGDHRQALAYCEQALTLHQRLDNRYGQAATWDSLGFAHHHLGQHAQARTCYQRAIDLLRILGNRYQEATTLSHLGDTHQVAGDPEAARDVYRRALSILDELDHPDAEKVRAKLTP